ncbi:MAG TPA: cbb3-type cytochrome c oxidase subunit I [Candidatus Acidoferrum sp.]|nr:cbb3-type cytochrome c oxidase subunit I [Candidatus Acidoferrum sp.]
MTVSMVSFDSENGGAGGTAPVPGFFARTLFNSCHKTLGLRYIWIALGCVLLGVMLSLLMRVHLVWPGASFSFLSGFGSTSDRHGALILLHGSLMVFFVLTTAPQAGFGSYFLPLQIGARELAFPLISLISFWTMVFSLAGIIAAFVVPPSAGFTLWTASVSLFCLSVVLTSINFIVTTIDLRTKGMTLPRMPLTAWAWFINAILSLLIFSILLVASVLLLSDRFLDFRFFPALNLIARQPTGLASSNLLSIWQRLFWFFAQAEVYVAILPCFGFVSHFLSTFSRKPVWAERASVLALCATGTFGFCIWGEHVFSCGLNPWSPLDFSLLAASLGPPACVLILSWFGTLWKARLQLNTAMLFTLGFVSLFLTGGASGLSLAGSRFSSAPVSNELIIAHFHLVMGVAATFALLAAFFFWFPKLFARRLNEALGKAHFWLTFVGVYLLFMPMHWLGLTASAGASAAPAGVSLAHSLRSVVTLATVLTVSAQALFVVNLIGTLWRSEPIEDCNPWRATTLEWSVPSPPPAGNFGSRSPVVFRGAYDFVSQVMAAGEDFLPQYVPSSPEEIGARRKLAAKSHAKEN